MDRRSHLLHRQCESSAGVGDSPGLAYQGIIINESAPAPPQAGWFTDPWNAQQIRYFDGQQWTAHVAQPETSAPLPSPPVSSGGYPFGEPTLFLQPIRGGPGSDIRCSITNPHGQPLALIQPLGEFPPGSVRELSKLVFEVVRPNGIQLLQFTRTTGAMGRGHHRLQVNDTAGHELGCLRQTSSYWQYLRTPWMSVDLECQDQRLGSTKIRTHIPPFTALELDAPITDANGTEIGRVRSQPNQSRLTRGLGMTKTTFDYSLDCARPTSPPMPALILATTFAHFLYDDLTSVAPLSGWSR
ncbi:MULTISPECIES: DUF2510 domain-containing protein [unclassified Mycolicibacterium]|uniref:DUF2510 domain-containing protein n=1 Tax=unclassified Mycolicibacterium TaxID=2636767 RepID=UPI0013079434|nr:MULTISPECIES: DUF2510 domain-containing protein [unclassified Mycolicibacterium]MUL82000.1 DUF2510 domain-containing protein [Mycolicibacterium sp. CBMA 329]MUL87766.1 DUF2510 domain-containing protein [Mycolicibacterium sp. CBMA 331]MUM01590.1 DUF2510 domain-containing protein [Mycolicibacterium sp. CBMA 334]MUM27287.1 DUF2510 domain-containing protein [Mycolicibacterium sp. CBMA 295]MUM38063.1 DUF2510 domain-containing protein [Mycolicibacterium sp. CBMA 247]